MPVDPSLTLHDWLVRPTTNLWAWNCMNLHATSIITVSAVTSKVRVQNRLHYCALHLRLFLSFVPSILFHYFLRFPYTDIDITLSVFSSLFSRPSTFPSLFIPFNSFLPTILIPPDFLLLTVILSRPLSLPSSQFSSKLKRVNLDTTCVRNVNLEI